MRNSKFMLSSWLILAVAVGVSDAAYAESGKISANISNGKKIFTEGKGAAAPCMSCHGEQAMGNDVMGAPRLANLGYAYVVKQLTDLGADRRTPSGVGAVMPGFAKELSEQDRRDVAAYVDSLEVEPEFSDLAALKEGGQQIGQKYLGQSIVNFGITIKNSSGATVKEISACSSCHGFNGRGADPMFPAIGQQKYVYLVNQLKNWRDSSRTNDPVVGGVGIMRAVAKNLTDDEINNVAAYLTSASKSTAGNNHPAENNYTIKNVAVTR